MTEPLAQSLLALDFSEEDAGRIDELNTRASEGTLTSEEQAELEAYVNIADLLAYWQSKARQVLQRPAGARSRTWCDAAPVIAASIVAFRKRRSGVLSTLNILPPGACGDTHAAGHRDPRLNLGRPRDGQSTRDERRTTADVAV